MVGVTQANLRMNVIGQFVLMHGFYRSSRTDGHKNRRFNRPVIGSDEASAGAALGIGMLKREGQGM